MAPNAALIPDDSGGVGSVGGTGTASLPYPVGSLKAPLTAAQRTKVMAYLAQQGYSAQAVQTYFSNLGTFSNFDFNAKDETIIDLYNTVAQGGGFGTGPTKTIYTGPGADLETGINAVGSFFNKLANGNTWVRIAEFAAGGILLAVGVAALISSSKTAQNAAQTAAGTAAVVK